MIRPRWNGILHAYYVECPFAGGGKFDSARLLLVLREVRAYVCARFMLGLQFAPIETHTRPNRNLSWPDFAYSTGGTARAGDNRMRENSEYVACPCCGEPMRLARTVSHAELPPLEMFECKPCGLAVSAEAVSGSHALIEKNYF
jgi:hypothetical protein